MSEKQTNMDSLAYKFGFYWAVSVLTAFAIGCTAGAAILVRLALGW